jgi:ankyrin repeat protein
VSNAPQQEQFVDAASHGDLAQMAALLASGAELNGNGTYWNALHAAIESMNEATARFLLSAGANPNWKCGGATPLIHAIDIEIDSVNQRLQRAPREEELPDPVITRLLLEHGADPNLRDPDGQTPFEFAQRRGHKHAADLLGRCTEG